MARVAVRLSLVVDDQRTTRFFYKDVTLPREPIKGDFIQHDDNDHVEVDHVDLLTSPDLSFFKVKGSNVLIEAWLETKSLHFYNYGPNPGTWENACASLKEDGFTERKDP